MEEPRTLKRSQLTVGLLLVALGLVFLFAQGLDLRFLQSWWPVFVLVPGLALLIVGIGAAPSAAPLAVPGSIVTAVGALLAFQNATGLWQTWAYLWPLVGPGAVGVGLAILGTRTGNGRLRATGLRLGLIGLVLAGILGVFFELVIGLSGPYGRVVGGVVWPLVLIAGGLWLIFGRRRGAR